MNRRELLTFGIHRKSRAVELSCERLYMKFSDSLLDNTTQELFDRLEAELRGVDSVLLVDTSWLSSEDLKQRLEPLLASVRARGVRISHSTGHAPNTNHDSMR
jgi:hypothetical protein